MAEHTTPTPPSQACVDLARYLVDRIADARYRGECGDPFSSAEMGEMTREIAERIHDVQTEAVHAAIR